MAIRKYYISAGSKPGYPFDRKARKFFSWGYDIWVNGRRVQERGFLTKPQAEAAVVQLKEQEKGPVKSETESPTLFDLFQKKLNATEPGQDRVRMKRVFQTLLALLEPGILVTDLRTAHLQQYVDHRSDVSNTTIRRELVPIVSALRSAYTFYESLDDYQPPRIPRPRVPKTRKERVISKTERDAIFKYLFAPRQPTELQTEPATRRRTGQFLLFCLLTLSRPGEVARLTAQDIDLEAHTVRITGTKSRFKASQVVRVLSLTETALQAVYERLPEADPYLFTPGGDVTPRMREHLKAACEAAGIPYGKNDPDGITFHTARHTGITMLIQAGMDIKTVGKLAGHSDASMTMYYTHSDPALVVKAGQILEAKMAKAVKK